MHYLLVAWFVLSKVLGSVAMPIEATEHAAASPVEVKLHDYFYDMFQLIKNDSNCDSSYNCLQISSHWCNANIIRSFKAAMQTDDATEQDCILKFSLSLIDTVIGADLALYRLPLAEPSENQSTTYTISIYEQFENDEDYLVASKEIGCETETWEVFHIDRAARNWTVGRSSTQFKINATDSSGNQLTNSEVLSMFIISEETCAIDGNTNGKYVCPDSQKTFQPIVTAFIDSTKPTDIGDTHCRENPEDCISNDRDTATETTVPPTGDAKDGEATEADQSNSNLIYKDLFERLGQTRMKRYNNMLEPSAARTKRSYQNTYQNNYVHMLLQNRREWQEEDCETYYNCQPVSSHHCNRIATAKLSGVNEVVNTTLGCDLKFTVALDSETDKKEGMDIALYRREDYQFDPDYDYIVIILYERGGPSIQDVAAMSYFSCEGWQIFLIDAVVNIVDVGDNNITLKLLVYKLHKRLNNVFYLLDCNETSLIFVLEDACFTEETQRSTQATPPTTESPKDPGDTTTNCSELKDSQSMVSGDCQDMHVGSKEEMLMMDKKETNVVTRSLDEYGPLVTFFLESFDPPFTWSLPIKT